MQTLALKDSSHLLVRGNSLVFGPCCCCPKCIKAFLMLGTSNINGSRVAISIRAASAKGQFLLSTTPNTLSGWCCDDTMMTAEYEESYIDNYGGYANISSLWFPETFSFSIQLWVQERDTTASIGVRIGIDSGTTQFTSTVPMSFDSQTGQTRWFHYSLEKEVHDPPVYLELNGTVSFSRK